MTEVRIPFLPIFKSVLAEGRKTVTSRTRRYGHIGDTFTVYGMRFEIISEPYRELVTRIRDTLWMDEGVSGPEEFEKIWRKIHPIIGIPPRGEAWVHRFKRLV